MKKYLLPLILTLILIFSANCFAITWDVDTSVYEDKYKDVSDEESLPFGIFFKSDGTKMYIVGTDADTVFQYSLSTPWDVSSASYEEKSFDASDECVDPWSMFFRSDGLKMYILDESFSEVYQYSLSTAWDVSSASYDEEYINTMFDGIMAPSSLFFKSDGTKMYVADFVSIPSKVHQYSLSEAWDVSSASYDEKYKDTSGEDAPIGLFFKSDGTKMYITAMENEKVYQYSLATAWEVDTASYEDKYKDVSSEDAPPLDLYFKSDGTKMYIVGGTNDIVYQYLFPDSQVNVLSFGTNF